GTRRQRQMCIRDRHPLGLPPSREEILAARAREGQRPEPLIEEHRVSPDDGHTQNETAIDTDGETVLAAFHRFGNNTLVLGVARSLDGGHTWDGAEVSGSHTVLTDPCVKSAGGGLWILSYLASGGIGGSDYDVFARRSTDNGATWGAPVAVVNDNGHDDKPYTAASGEYVVVGYADFGFSPAKVRAVRSTNGGVSFNHDTILANNSGGGNGACPIIDPSGIFHVFWRDSYQDSLWVSHSTDQGLTWSADRGIVEMHPLPSTLPPGFRMVNLPSAAADPLTGAIVVVWNDQLYGDPDILSVRSTDGGQTWSAPIRVNDDAPGATQFFPWIAFDPHGTAHVCWYDRRENGSDIDVYYAKSTDDGASWDANVRVTPASFPPILPWDTTTPFLGDYNAIAANATTVFPCYMDAREGNQDVYVALLPGGPAGSVADGAPLAAGRFNAQPLLAAPSLFGAGEVVTCLLYT
ncbi:MAG: sialidase family protein, partial [Candidatus Eisenbacteria bacterium]|nr:sialidase family protein [Candidatus Eisenbacteria bacterium]